MTVCHPMRTIARNHVPSCLYALYMGMTEHVEELCKIKTFKSFKPKFYKPENSVDYIYSVPRRTAISGQCDRALPSGTFPSSIEGTGRITIPPSCVAHSEQFVLLGNGILNMGNVKIQSTVDFPHIETLPTLAFLGKFNLSLSNPKYQTLNQLFSDKSNSKSNDEVAEVDLEVLMDEVQKIHLGTAGEISHLSWTPWVILAGVLVTVGAIAVFARSCQRTFWRHFQRTYNHTDELPHEAATPGRSPEEPHPLPRPRFVARYKTVSGEESELQPVVLST